MSSKLRTNEVSWKIEVIGEINNYVRNKQLKITKASGEMTVTAIRKFPDVLLFGGLGEQLLQGWELKMPDTPITADDPLKPAEQKARALGLNSFLVWNARDAALYIKDESDTFVIVKEWPTSVEIKTRDDVDKKRNVWVDRLHDIIDTIEILLSGYQIKAIRAIDTINKEVYSEYIEDASPRIADLIKTEMQHNREFMAEVAKWWSYEKNSYPKDSDRVEILAKIVVVNWMNKFLFAHYLKRYYSVAREVDDLTEKSTVDDGIELFEKICDQCGFADVFGTMIADDCIDDMSWDMLIELNNYLKSVLIQNISPESLQAMLEKVVDISKRETYGQYTTPKVLARLLVDLTMKDSGELLFDPCCGTGTIIKAAEELKKERGVQNYMETIWASDKFSYPLRLTTFNLFEPDIPDTPLQIFREDIFDLETGSVVTMVYPRSGEHFEKELPVFDTIVSNLPFVNFEAIPKDDKEKMGDSLGRKSDLYAYISIYLSRLLKEEGRVGVIVSNSWLYSEWGQQFKEQLLQQYVLEKVIISQSGRWFKNAKIVTNILILKKKSTDRSEKELTSFISTAHRIEYWADEQIYEEMVTDIWTENVNSESVYINQYTREEMKDIASVGLGPMVFFTDVHWYRRLKGSVVKGASLFDIKRGERKGWDKMFYPSTTNSIEKNILSQ